MEKHSVKTNLFDSILIFKPLVKLMIIIKNSGVLQNYFSYLTLLSFFNKNDWFEEFCKALHSVSASSRTLSVTNLKI